MELTPTIAVQQYTDKLVNAASVDQRIYPGVGHVIPLEIPGQSAEDLRLFLKEQ